jgi:hypothetical protein
VKRRRRAAPVMISMRENVSDIGITPGLCLGLPAMAGVRSKTVFSSPCRGNQQAGRARSPQNDCEGRFPSNR